MIARNRRRRMRQACRPNVWLLVKSVALASSLVCVPTLVAAQPPQGAIVVRPQRPVANDVSPVDAEIEEVKKQFPPGTAKVGQSKGFGEGDFDWPWFGLLTKSKYMTSMLLNNKCTSAKQVQVLIGSSLQPYLGLAKAEVGHMNSRNEFESLEGKELVGIGPNGQVFGVDAVTTLRLEFRVHTPDHLDLPDLSSPGPTQGFDQNGNVVVSNDPYETYPVDKPGTGPQEIRVPKNHYLPIQGLVVIQALNPGSDCLGNPMVLRTGGRVYARPEEPPPPPPETGSWDCRKWWEETRVPPPPKDCTVEFRELALEYVQKIRPTEGLEAADWRWLPSDVEIGGMSSVQLVDMKRRADVQLIEQR